MELAEKGSLAHVISKGGLAHDDWPTKMRLANEIAQGLAFIHEESIVHCNLKSMNVLLTKHMEAKIGDFGQAIVQSKDSAPSESSWSSRSIHGAIRWMAPELLFDPRSENSTKSDVYSLGVVMWEMAANCTRPFKNDDDDARVAMAISKGDREIFPVDTPAEYRGWGERCWAQDPMFRPDASKVVLVDDRTEDEDELDTSSESPLFSWTDDDNGDGDGEDEDGEDGDDGDKDVDNVGDGNVVVYGSEPQPIPEIHDDDLDSRLPRTDNDVVANLCMAAKQGVAAAQVRIAKMYEQGQGVDASNEKTVSWYRRAANSGRADAQHRLDEMEAVMGLTKAAEQGDASAQVRLRRIYAEGGGVDKSYTEAANWFTKAAEQGDTSAQVRLGTMHAEGDGVDKSPTEEAKWFTKAAELGDASAQVRLETMYAEGGGVDKRYTGTAKRLTKAAEHGDISAQAAKWFTKAAEQGDASAQVRLGAMYAEGDGVDKNYTEAAKWFTKAAKQGDAGAQVRLGTMYAEGDGVDKSYTEAAKWFTKAAEQKDASAQFHLGMMCKRGHGVEQSDDDAVIWFIRAAEQGNASAQFNLGMMCRRGHGVEQSDDWAAIWFTRAAKQGDASAQFHLGMMYAEGKGVKQSDVDAVMWFTKATQQGHGDSQKVLEEMYQPVQQIDNSDVEMFGWPTKVSSLIGSGPYGEVYYAEKSGRPCVIKTLFLRHADFLRADIEKEAAILQTLVHEHITEFYGAGFAGPRIHLFAELVGNGNLANQIKWFGMSEATRSRLGYEIAQGLQYIHSNGILHRSLKSTNVLLTRELKAKICDFGLPTVRELKQLRSNWKPTRDVRWMAPELLSVKPAFSTKSDMYAFGMVLWEMAAACTIPFKYTLSDITVMKLVKDQKREVLPGLTPPGYASLVLSCWSHDPTERPKASQVQYLSGSLWMEMEQGAQDDALVDDDDNEDAHSEWSDSGSDLSLDSYGSTIASRILSFPPPEAQSPPKA
ncbi:hypothetical protein DFQ26_002863 [Actinomortierella ambigua]|nr:hypothetical protein DFQ26_002863 [Actinomortierella ambigua]